MLRPALLTATLAVGIGLVNFAQTTPPAPAAKSAAKTAAPGPIFPKGEPASAANFTGQVHVYTLVKDDPTFTCVGSNVSFAPGARTHWHSHPAGQILLITEGVGYYQEKGQPIRLLRQGDVVKAQPGVEHWHGASPLTFRRAQAPVA